MTNSFRRVELVLLDNNTYEVRVTKRFAPEYGGGEQTFVENGGQSVHIALDVAKTMVTVSPSFNVKTYRCALFSPDKGQCTLTMYHEAADHRFDPSSPWTETLEELTAFYELREKQENARDPRNEINDDVDEDDSVDDEFSGDRDLAIGERDDEVNVSDRKRGR